MCRPHSEWCEKANRNFLLTSDNRMERHRLHPGNYPGRSPFPECVKLKGQALIKGWWLAPTLAGFYRVLNPWPQLLWAPSNHSATSAVMLPLYRPDFNRWECSLQHANCHELWHKHWGNAAFTVELPESNNRGRQLDSVRWSNYSIRNQY